MEIRKVFSFEETAKRLIIDEGKSVEQVRYMLKRGAIETNLSEDQINEVFQNISNLYKVTIGIEKIFSDIILFNVIDFIISIGLFILIPRIFSPILIPLPFRFLVILLYYGTTEAIWGRTIGLMLVDAIRVDRLSKKMSFWQRILIYPKSLLTVTMGFRFPSNYYNVSYREWKQYAELTKKIDELGK